MWMKENEYEELKDKIGSVITIYYHWDGAGHRIFDSFKNGDHSNAFTLIIIDTEPISFRFRPIWER